MYDILIIGGGPAGISAAIYAKSRGCNVLVLEQSQLVDKSVWYLMFPLLWTYER